MAMKPNSVAILKFLQANDGKDLTAKDIAAGVGLQPNQVTGSVNAFCRHKKLVGEDKVDDPLAYREEVKIEGGVIKYIRLTEAGKTFVPEEA